MGYVLTALAGYLLGSVSVALLVAGRHGVDLRRTADGNPGAWNALEQLGPGRAWPVFAGDGLKGAVAGAVGWGLTGDVAGAYAGVAAAMAGHAFPLRHRLRGGKAVMTFVGGLFVVAPLAAVPALALCVAVAVAARSFALGARVGLSAVVPLELVLYPSWQVAATLGLMLAIGVLFLTRRSGPATSATA